MADSAHTLKQLVQYLKLEERMKLLELAECFRSAATSERELLAGYGRLKDYRQGGAKFQELPRQDLRQNYLSTLKLRFLKQARSLELANATLRSKQQAFRRIHREAQALEAARNQVETEAQRDRRHRQQKELDEMGLLGSSRQPGRQLSFVLL